MRRRGNEVGRTRRARGTARCPALTLVLLVAVVAGGGPGAGAQGLGGAGAGQGAGGAASPRGSAVNPWQFGDGADGPERFGGLEGGEGRRSGTAGSASRGLTRSNPGDPDESRLPPPIGASGTVGGESVPGLQGPSVLGGRMSRMAVPVTRPGQGPATDRQGRLRRLSLERQRVEPPESDPLTLAHRPRLEIPPGADDPGPDDGLTLDAAIERLVRQNLDAYALRYEIPKAEADVLTAGLRNNPIVYGDAQFVPYGHYTNLRPGGGGGQPQYDFNVSLPLDVSGKRRARVDVARRALKVTEAQLQDETRKLIDQLNTAFVNVLAARETLRYSEAFLAGMSRLFAQAEADLQKAEEKTGSRKDDRDARNGAEQQLQAARDARDELRSQERQAHYQVWQVTQSLVRTTRTLAQLLYLSPDEARALRVRGRLREAAPVPDEAWLVQTALASRPDLVAYRLGAQRAEADVRLARANRLSDMYLVYQPYTFQDGRAFGLKGTYSYGVGVSAALPLFNRNQGNIARAEWNVAQTRVELKALEYQVTQDVLSAYDDLRFGLAGVLELEREMLPAARKARDDAYREYRRDPSKAGDYLDEQRDYNEAVQQYRNALIQLRQDMLDLNTAVGLRVMP
jgi:cobalt-zinc-cadmium efflux system outer membrane protein